MADHSSDNLEILDLDDLFDDTQSRPSSRHEEKSSRNNGKELFDDKKESPEDDDFKMSDAEEAEFTDAGSADGSFEDTDFEEVDLQESDFGYTDFDDLDFTHVNGSARSSASSGKPRSRNKSESGRQDSRSSAFHSPQSRSRGRRRRAFPIVQVILLAVIASVLIVAICLLLVWNRGRDSQSLGIDPEANQNRYNVEVNDNIIYLTDSQLSGHEDDGITTILCLGDEPFSQNRGESGLAGQIAALGGDTVSVINASFPGSQVTCKNPTYLTDSLENMDDIFNLFYVSYALTINDFSSFETVASLHTDDSSYSEAVQALENTDMDKVDMIAIMYDASDYVNGASMQNPDNPDELTTYVGSLSNSFTLLQEAFPYIRIVFMSPYYEEYDGESGRTTDNGNGTITNYFQWAYDTCASASVSFLDNYYGSVNENNYQTYTSDGIHLNAAGCTKIADHFVWKVIQGNYGEYNVEEMGIQ